MDDSQKKPLLSRMLNVFRDKPQAPTNILHITNGLDIQEHDHREWIDVIEKQSTLRVFSIDSTENYNTAMAEARFFVLAPEMFGIIKKTADGDINPKIIAASLKIIHAIEKS